MDLRFNGNSMGFKEIHQLKQGTTLEQVQNKLDEQVGNDALVFAKEVNGEEQAFIAWSDEDVDFPNNFDSETKITAEDGTAVTSVLFLDTINSQSEVDSVPGQKARIDQLQKAEQAHFKFLEHSASASVSSNPFVAVGHSFMAGVAGLDSLYHRAEAAFATTTVGSFMYAVAEGERGLVPTTNDAPIRELIQE